MPHFVPRTILISGATGGIGSALAKCYASPNTTLILTGRNEQRLDEIADYCRKKNAQVITHAFDMTDEKILVDWLGELMKTISIDLVIANAGISIGILQQGHFESLEKTIELMQINLLALIKMIHPIIKDMKKRKSGQIALMSSLAAFRGLPQSPAYCASKAAIRIYGESLRALLRNEGIFVSVICPGFVQTAMSEQLHGPKPFLLTADEAAKIIRKKLQKKYSEIIFPLQLALILKLLKILPMRWTDYLLLKVKTHS